MNHVKDFSMDIPEDAWEEIGVSDDKAACLYIGCTIAGMPMHLQAIAVHDTEDTLFGLVADDGAYSKELDAIYDLCGQDTPGTLTIRGREYVLVASPPG